MSSVDRGDPHELLGLTPDASPDDLTRAYRRLARQIHPDVTDDPAAAEHFRALTAAYQRLLAAAAAPRPRSVPVSVRRVRTSARPPLVAGPVHVEPPTRRGGDGNDG